MNIFRTDSKHYRLSVIAAFDKLLALCRRKLDLGRACSKPYLIAFYLAYSVDKVHLRRSDESCYEQVARIIIQCLRSIYLLYDTSIHNYDSCTKGHSLCLVMRYIDNCGSQSLMQLGDLNAHLSTKFCV